MFHIKWSSLLMYSMILLSPQGTHKSLGSNLKAKATVGAIIDGFGSLGN